MVVAAEESKAQCLRIDQRYAGFTPARQALA